MKDGLTVTRWSFNVFCASTVRWQNRIQHLCEKTISGFPVSPHSVETPVRWGGEIKQFFIAYFLGNIFAKNYQNLFMYIIAIVCNIRVVFETRCIMAHEYANCWLFTVSGKYYSSCKQIKLYDSSAPSGEYSIMTSTGKILDKVWMHVRPVLSRYNRPILLYYNL